MFALVLYTADKKIDIVDTRNIKYGKNNKSDISVLHGRKFYKATIIKESPDKKWLETLDVSEDGLVSRKHQSIVKPEKSKTTKADNKANIIKRKQVAKERDLGILQQAKTMHRPAAMNTQSIIDGIIESNAISEDTEQIQVNAQQNNKENEVAEMTKTQNEVMKLNKKQEDGAEFKKQRKKERKRRKKEEQDAELNTEQEKISNLSTPEVSEVTEEQKIERELEKKKRKLRKQEKAGELSKEREKVTGLYNEQDNISELINAQKKDIKLRKTQEETIDLNKEQNKSVDLINEPGNITEAIDVQRKERKLGKKQEKTEELNKEQEKISNLSTPEVSEVTEEQKIERELEKKKRKLRKQEKAGELSKEREKVTGLYNEQDNISELINAQKKDIKLRKTQEETIDLNKEQNKSVDLINEPGNITEAIDVQRKERKLGKKQEKTEELNKEQEKISNLSTPEVSEVTEEQKIERELEKKKRKLRKQEKAGELSKEREKVTGLYNEQDNISELINAQKKDIKLRKTQEETIDLNKEQNKSVDLINEPGNITEAIDVQRKERKLGKKQEKTEELNKEQEKVSEIIEAPKKQRKLGKKKEKAGELNKTNEKVTVFSEQQNKVSELIRVQKKEILLRKKQEEATALVKEQDISVDPSKESDNVSQVMDVPKIERKRGKKEEKGEELNKEREKVTTIIEAQKKEIKLGREQESLMKPTEVNKYREKVTELRKEQDKDSEWIEAQKKKKNLGKMQDKTGELNTIQEKVSELSETQDKREPLINLEGNAVALQEKQDKISDANEYQSKSVKKRLKPTILRIEKVTVPELQARQRGIPEPLSRVEGISRIKTSKHKLDDFKNEEASCTERKRGRHAENTICTKALVHNIETIKDIVEENIEVDNDGLIEEDDKVKGGVERDVQSEIYSCEGNYKIQNMGYNERKEESAIDSIEDNDEVDDTDEEKESSAMGSIEDDDEMRDRDEQTLESEIDSVRDDDDDIRSRDEEKEKVQNGRELKISHQAVVSDTDIDADDPEISDASEKESNSYLLSRINILTEQLPPISADVVKYFHVFGEILKAKYEIEARKNAGKVNMIAGCSSAPNLLQMASMDGDTKIELQHNSGIFVGKDDLSHVLEFSDKPANMARRLMRMIVGDNQLRQSSAGGRGVRPGIPENIKNVVFGFVNKNRAQGAQKLKKQEFTRTLNCLCATLRSKAKEKPAKKPNPASSVPSSESSNM